MSLFGGTKELNQKISQLEQNNVELLQQVNSKLKEIEDLNNILNNRRNEFQEAQSKISSLTLENDKSKNIQATLQRENEKLIAHIKNIEEAEERHERVLPALISANVSFARTVINIKSLNAETLRKLKAVPEKYTFLVNDHPNSVVLSNEKEEEIRKMFYPRGGDYSPEQYKMLKERGGKEFNFHNVKDVTHHMLERLIVINGIMQEIEKVILEKARNIKVLQAANDVSHKVIKRYAETMHYFQYAYSKRNWKTQDNGIISTNPEFIFNSEALKALKNQAMTEEHVESLNRTIVKLFREILFELNDIKTKHDSSVELKNLDIFSKEMYGMFNEFNKSLDREKLQIASEIKKYSELINKLSNEEDVALNQVVKSLSITLQDSISEEELIIKVATKNIS